MVTNVAVEQVAVWARWPKFEELYGALGLNLVLFAWMLRLALDGQQERGGRSRVRSSIPYWHEGPDGGPQEPGDGGESPPANGPASLKF